MKVYGCEVKVVTTDGKDFDVNEKKVHPILIDGISWIDYKAIGDDESHILKPRNGIGKHSGGATLLVEVEKPGVTIKQLANLFIYLGCDSGSYATFDVIDEYQKSRAQAEDEADDQGEEKHTKRRHHKKKQEDQDE